MVRYSLLNDLARAHHAHVLREAARAHSSATRLGSWVRSLRALWMSLV